MAPKVLIHRKTKITTASQPTNQLTNQPTETPNLSSWSFTILQRMQLVYFNSCRFGKIFTRQFTYVNLWKIKLRLRNTLDIFSKDFWKSTRHIVHDYNEFNPHWRSSYTHSVKQWIKIIIFVKQRDRNDVVARFPLLLDFVLEFIW